MPLTQVNVGNIPSASLNDGAQPTVLGGKAGEAVVAELHGKYYTQSYRGNVFVGSTAIGGVVPAAYNSLTPTYVIWNPAGSGKNIVPIKFQAGLVTNAVITGNFVWASSTNVGSQVGTGSPVISATIVAPQNLNLGSTTKSVANFIPATSSLTNAPTFLKSCGVSMLSIATPTSVTLAWQVTEYYDGEFIIAPGTLAAVGFNIAGVATWDISTIWEEVPV